MKIGKCLWDATVSDNCMSLVCLCYSHLQLSLAPKDSTILIPVPIPSPSHPCPHPCLLSCPGSRTPCFARRGQQQRRKATHRTGLAPWQRLQRKAGTKDFTGGVYPEWTHVALTLNWQTWGSPCKQPGRGRWGIKASGRSRLYRTLEHKEHKCTWSGIHVCLSIHKYTAPLIN